MPTSLIIVLLLLAFLLPILGAVLVRLNLHRLEGRMAMAIAITMIIVPTLSVVVLSRADIPNLSIAGVNLLLIDPTPVPLPADLLDGLPTDDTPHNDDEDVLPSATPAPPTVELPTAAPAEPTPEPPTVAPAEPTPEPPTAAPAEPTPELPTAAPADPTTAPPPAPRTYTVQAGDTLRVVAERNNVSVQALLDANSLTPAQGDALRQGQELIIP